MMSTSGRFTTAFLLLISCRACSSSNCTQQTKDPSKVCSIRFDLYTGNSDGMYVNHTCEDQYKFKPICNGILKIHFYELPPYIYKFNGTEDGVLPALLKIIMKTCCFTCTRLEYMEPFKTVHEMAWFYNASAYSIMMPAVALSTSQDYFGNPFVKLLDTPGVVYVTIDNSSQKAMERLLRSVGDTWPIFVIVTILTIEGGVIIWLLDQHENPEEFPKSFFRGVLEGSWWSYISMTTVGYGDKTPRSIQGRLFAFLWITMGIATTGVFTASLASSLTSAALPGKTSLSGLQVGVLRQVITTYEQNIIYREGGTPKVFANVKDMVKALEKGEITGILADAFVLDYHWNEIKSFNLNLERKTDIVSSKTAIGMMFSGPALQPWATFLSSFIEENKDAESRLLIEARDRMKDKFSMGRVEDSTSGTSMYKSFIAIIMPAGISSAATLLFASVFQCLRTKYHARKRENNVEEMATYKGHKIMDEQLHQLSNRIESLQDIISQMRAELDKKDTKA